ncbi:mitochondrial 39-S ribosomal protein L47 (MRP-L47)-domain-containing protein [Sporodiniella umbellata]|nr:mitochondrial 39-S ribosomal protein L47 (MRP-L47)-domain-containing protein [Sporodiniella umbellata]
MSILQRITQSRLSKSAIRSFSTSFPTLAESATPVASTKPKGLYQFFENNQALPEQIWTGRSWKAKELRQKSFEDLHKLWYVLLKERNLLATQKHEASRLNIPTQTWTNRGRMMKCQKSMARIKCVLNERQREFEISMAAKK